LEYYILRLKYRCFVYALSMIFPSLYRLYPISHILYRIPYIVYPIIAYPKKFFKNVQNLKNFKFSKKFKICIRFQKFQIFIQYMYYQRHGWNIWYNEHYMSKSISHAVSNLDLGWCRVLGLIRHVIQILTCNIQYIL
jgi:hypothetical protein